MPLSVFKATDFRCLQTVELEFDPTASLITGPNGAGKTSLLEAVAYLGRGKSFRGAATQNLIRHGEKALVVFGQVERAGKRHRVGVSNGADGLEISIDGDKTGGAAALAEMLPLQIIDPNIHDLVGGGPEQRRRYLDWLAFHVEHGYVDVWRKFRRVLKQRNAALKSGVSEQSLDSWDSQFVELSEQVAAARSRVFEVAQPVLEETAGQLLEASIGFEYRRGWAGEESLRTVLLESRERDLNQGNTQFGPQRADVRLRYDERQAKRLVSRGQQKLLACSMILGATELVQTQLEEPLLLLLDDPAAELDRESLGRLMGAVNGLGCQVIATALAPDTSIFEVEPAVFHVEHGRLEQAR